VTAPTAQLLLYAFREDAVFQGALVGALERLESGGALRILGALFVQRDARTGEIAAIDLRGRGAGSAVAPLLGFRLDAAERRRATDRALDDEAGGLPGATVSEIARSLEPGTAVAAVLVEHVWAGALADAVERSGGISLGSRLVAATALADVTSDLLAAARQASAGA